MGISHGHEGLQSPRMIGRRVDRGPAPEPMSATVFLRSLEVAGYGRHAAPPSAYGPADVHRLLPVPSTGSPAKPADAEDTLVELVDHAVRAEVVATADVATGAQSSGEEATKPTGFWARLRLLPKAA